MAPGKPRAYGYHFCQGNGKFDHCLSGVGKLNQAEMLSLKSLDPGLTTRFDRWKLILFILLLTLRPSSETFLKTKEKELFT